MMYIKKISERKCIEILLELYYTYQKLFVMCYRCNMNCFIIPFCIENVYKSILKRHGTLEAELDSIYMRRLLVFVMTAILWQSD